MLQKLLSVLHLADVTFVKASVTHKFFLFVRMNVYL